MVGVLILTHGPLADELVAAAETINGQESCGVKSLCLDWDVEPEEALELVRRSCEEAAGEGGLLILTDLRGGTPYNVARRLVGDGSVALVSGVNLPMVVRLCCSRREKRPLAELADWITAKGKTSISLSPAGAC